MTPLEIAANLFNLLSILLATLNHVGTWPTGIIGCALYGVMFFGVRLYADVTLQVFFVVTSVYGWWHWMRGGAGKTEAPVRRLGLQRTLLACVAGLVLTAIYGLGLQRWTNASYPFIDSAVLMFSVIAQVLLMRRLFENWALWIVVNGVAAPLYESKGLHLTAILYVGFFINAVVALVRWRRLVTDG